MFLWQRVMHYCPFSLLIGATEGQLPPFLLAIAHYIALPARLVVNVCGILECPYHSGQLVLECLCLGARTTGGMCSAPFSIIAAN